MDKNFPWHSWTLRNWNLGVVRFHMTWTTWGTPLPGWTAQISPYQCLRRRSSMPFRWSRIFTKESLKEISKTNQSTFKKMEFDLIYFHGVKKDSKHDLKIIKSPRGRSPWSRRWGHRLQWPPNRCPQKLGRSKNIQNISKSEKKKERT